MTETDKIDEKLEMIGIDHLLIFDIESEKEFVNQRGSALSNEVKDDE